MEHILNVPVMREMQGLHLMLILIVRLNLKLRTEVARGEYCLASAVYRWY